MNGFAVRAPVLMGVIWVCSVTRAAGDAPSLSPLHATRLGELGRLFDAASARAQLDSLSAPILLGFQAFAAVLVIGGLLQRLRVGAELMESVASSILRVFFIASVPLWSSLLLESADALSAAVAPSFFEAPAARSTTESSKSRSSLSEALWRVEEQWSLDASPALDSSGKPWTSGDGKEDERLRESWNWARAGLSGTKDTRAGDWELHSGLERAGIVQRLVMGTCSLVQGTEALCHLLPLVRHLCWTVFVVCSPVLLALVSLGGHGLLSPRALLAGFGVALWPLGWALANCVSEILLQQFLTLLRNMNASAMYPRLEEGVSARIAWSAPYFSWSLLGLLAVLTAVLCLWVLGAQIFGSVLLQRLLGGRSGAKS